MTIIIKWKNLVANWKSFTAPICCEMTGHQDVSRIWNPDISQWETENTLKTHLSASNGTCYPPLLGWLNVLYQIPAENFSSLFCLPKKYGTTSYQRALSEHVINFITTNNATTKMSNMKLKKKLEKTKFHRRTFMLLLFTRSWKIFETDHFSTQWHLWRKMAKHFQFIPPKKNFKNEL